MTPDWSRDPDPVPYADLSNPQSLNLYVYARNNPLSFVDRDGHDCTAQYTYVPSFDFDTGDLEFTYEQTGFTCTSTSTPLDDTDSDSGWFSNIGQNLTDAVGQTVNAITSFMTQPRNPGCMAAMTGAGSAIGTGVGAIGIAGGPTVAATEPTGFLLGGGAGYALGLVSCMSGSGGGGGGGGGSRGSTGRTTPNNPKEASAMAEAKASPKQGARLPIKLSDSRWPAGQGWVKMARNIDGVEIHWNLNLNTDETDDWKFIDY